MRGMITVLRARPLLRNLGLRVLPAVFAISWLTGCAGGSNAESPKIVRREADRIHQALAPALVEEPRVHLYFQRLAQRVTASATVIKPRSTEMATWTLQIHLLDTRVPTAFTAGGEHLYLSNGLFQMTQTEDELASVIAHEYAHIVLEQIARSEDLLSEKIDERILEKLLVYRFVVQGYLAADEANADAFGSRTVAAAGWDSGGLGTVIERASGSRERLASARAAAGRSPVAGDGASNRPVADRATFGELKVAADAAASRGEARGGAHAGAAQLVSAFPGCITSGGAAQVKAQGEIKEALESVTLPQTKRSDLHGPDSMGKSAWWTQYLKPTRNSIK